MPQPTIRMLLESRIHQGFTDAADQLASRGYLSRDERIAARTAPSAVQQGELSSLIGDVLGEFGESVESTGTGDRAVETEDARSIADAVKARIRALTGAGASESVVIPDKGVKRGRTHQGRSDGTVGSGRARKSREEAFSEANYRPATGSERCDNCRYYWGSLVVGRCDAFDFLAKGRYTCDAWDPEPEELA